MRLEKWQANILTKVPFIMLLYTVLAGVFSKSEMYKYLAAQGYLGHAVGYSLVTCFAQLILFSNKHFCLEVKLASWGCFLMPLVAIVLKYFMLKSYITIMGYGVSYDLIIFSIVTLVLMRYLFVRLVEYVKK